ncbi:MAG: phospholipid carrier-dependent glycosyltransferase [Syntrophaceae bacterium]|nr:phospholipid carrier-dependent glycosyltransferase [Syntrophaceae bacterium]
MSINKNHVIDHLLTVVICIAILALLSIEFLLNLTPPIARDSLIHHLAIPKLWLKNGGFYEIKWANFSYYPMNIELLYIIPLYFNKDFIASFIHMSFGIGTAFLIYYYLKNKISSIAGLLGVLVFLSTPIVFRLSTQVYVDLGLIFFTTASILSFIRWRDGEFKEFKWLFLSAMAMGLALGTKYNALIVWFFLSAAIVFVYSGHSKKQWKAIGCGSIFFLISLLIFSPWLIKNTILTGNPFYPLFRGIFDISNIATQEGTYSIVFGRIYKGIFQVREMMYGESFWEILFVPLRYFFQGQDNNPRYFDGVLNPILIILPPFALMNKSFYRDKLFFMVFVVFFILVATFLDQTRIRYILPAVPILSILTIMGLINIFNWTMKLSTNLRNFSVVVLLSIFIAFMSKNILYIKDYYHNISPMRYVLGTESRDDFIARHNSGYAAIKYINTHTPENSKIRLILFAGRGYYLDRLYEEGQYFGMADINGLVANARDDASFHAYLNSLGHTHFLIRTNLFEKFLRDNYNPAIRSLLSRRMNKAMNLLYNKDGCAVYEIITQS